MSVISYPKSIIDALIASANTYTDQAKTAANQYTDSALAAANAGLAPWQVAVSSFPGSTPDARLSACLSTIAAETFKREIVMDEYNVTYSTFARPTFTGLKLCGRNVGWQNAEPSIAAPWPFTVNVGYDNTAAGGSNQSWFIGGAQTYDISFRNMALKSGNGASQFYSHPTSNGTSYGLYMDTLNFYGWKHVLGNPNNPFSSTLLTWVGPWTVNGIFGEQFTLNLSDSLALNPTCMNIGAGSTAGAGRFIIIINYVGKSNMSGIYVTANNGWAGFLLKGDTKGAVGFCLTASVVEGRNQTDPSDGALIRSEGGKAFIQNTSINYGLGNVAANGRGEVAFIEVAGGYVIADNITMDFTKAIGYAASLIMNVSSGYGKITNVHTGNKDQVAQPWVGLPRRRNVNVFDESTQAG